MVKFTSIRELEIGNFKLPIPEEVRDSTIRKMLSLLEDRYKFMFSKSQQGYTYVYLKKDGTQVALTRTRNPDVIKFFKDVNNLIEFMYV